MDKDRSYAEITKSIGSRDVANMDSTGNSKYSFTWESAKSYLTFKLRFGTVAGLVSGAIRGYYVGDLTLRYSLTHGIGFGIVTTAFYLGTYTIRNIRESDELIHYAAMGFIQGGALASATHGLNRKGLIGGAIGTILGTTLKLSGDSLYENSRYFWLHHRNETTNRPIEMKHRIHRPIFEHPPGFFDKPQETVKREGTKNN